ncbi:leucine-rich repeat-containing protein 3B isoform X2 [Mustela erminea]|uniref:leucine-rich repeat-containing protein 3B isoform X2 n=1 Tax=Mustela erminea TaxID=36723 RepID=UPI001387011C|nr:leucine-rich repeat-containing protein 3B isoform X2 [Mustela erminea]
MGGGGSEYSHLNSSPPAVNAQPPPSLSIPDPPPGWRQGSAGEAAAGLRLSRSFPAAFPVPCLLAPPPSSQPGFGGDSPLVTETIASGRAALRLPRVFVSSSCEAPGPGAGSAAAAAEAGAQRCSARPPGAAPSLGGGAGGRQLATHCPRPALQPPRTNAAAATRNEPSGPAGFGVGSPARSEVGRAAAAVLAAHTPSHTHPTPPPCATRMEQPPRPGTGARPLIGFSVYM